MTCPHCKDTGVSPGASDLGGPGTMSPCDCDAGLAWVAWGGDIERRIWLWDKGYHVSWYDRPDYTEVIPISAYRAQRDSLMALLRQANDRADRAEQRLVDAGEDAQWAR